jgi:hypothetical protein
MYEGFLLALSQLLESTLWFSKFQGTSRKMRRLLRLVRHIEGETVYCQFLATFLGFSSRIFLSTSRYYIVTLTSYLLSFLAFNTADPVH